MTQDFAAPPSPRALACDAERQAAWSAKGSITGTLPGQQVNGRLKVTQVDRLVASVLEHFAQSPKICSLGGRTVNLDDLAGMDQDFFRHMLKVHQDVAACSMESVSGKSSDCRRFCMDAALMNVFMHGPSAKQTFCVDLKMEWLAKVLTWIRLWQE